MSKKKKGLKYWCGHTKLTSEDGEGYAICLDCGLVVVVRMTAEIFDRSMRAIKRRDGGG